MGTIQGLFRLLVVQLKGAIVQPQHDVMASPFRDAMRTNPDTPWLRGVIALLENFRREDHSLTVSQALLFLHTAIHDNEMGLQELATVSGLTRATAFNGFKVLGERGRGEVTPWELIEDVPSLTDGRSKLKKLTPQGRGLIEKLHRAAERLAWSILREKDSDGNEREAIQ